MTRKCPKCGSTHVQLTSENSKLGCLWLILFGWVYVAWIIIKWIIGFYVFVLLDWWLAILCAVFGKGYVWKSRKYFSGTKRIFYCHDCGYNFRD